MKTFYTIFVALLLIASTALADGRNEYLRVSYSAYSTNDTNVVLVGTFNTDNFYTATNLNMAKGTSETYLLEVDNSTELLDVQMNTKARLIYYFTYKKVYIYEFGAAMASRIITIDNSSSNFGISGDGTKIYSYDNKQDYVSIFDAVTGERTERFFVNSFTDNNKQGFFNSGKDEFLLQKDDSMFVWSIENKIQDRVITVIKSSENYKFIDNGNVLTYTVGGEVIWANSSDGKVTNRKDFGYKNIDRIEFSPNMEYLIAVGDPISFSLYDTQNDKLLIDSKQLLDNGKYVPFYYYVNNDNSRAVAAQLVSDNCYKDGEIPLADYIYFIYKTNNYDKVVSAPIGFIPRPEKTIVSKDNKVLIITGYNAFRNLTSALVDNQENFIKYINVDSIPRTFLEDNNRIALMEEGIFKVYNIETEVFEREFDTGKINFREVYFFAKGTGRIAITDDSEINIYDYSNFKLLYTFNYKQLGLVPTEISFDNNSSINLYSQMRIYNFNVYMGEMSDSPVTNIDTSDVILDISINGRYLLYLSSENQLIVYDNLSKSEVFNDIPNLQDSDLYFSNSGFFGNHEIMWFKFVKNPMDTDPLVATFDFVSKTTELIHGDFEPVISNDGGLYYSHKCPLTYKIGAIRDPKTSVEATTTLNGSVYPNPASDFIQLEFDMNIGISEIEIFDAYGKQVMSVIYNAENIDISKLTAGVYFVKTPSHSYKFIKL